MPGGGSVGLGLVSDVAIVASAALAATGLIVTLWPWLQRYALARPNARSSHKTPTPQGGGIAIVGLATLALLFIAMMSWGRPAMPTEKILGLACALLGLGLLGAVDDVRPMPVWPRLILQTVAVAVLLTSLPSGLDPLPWLPPWVEFLVLAAGLIWFINLTNFMDGIDWITVAAFVPMLVALVIFAHMGLLSAPSHVLALVLLGGLLGFAPFNKPVAQLFLGDVGSLALGAGAGYELIEVAGHGHVDAALLLTLYHLADATVTLVWRYRGGERLSQAHRSHFYQVAVQRGMRASDVVTRVFLLQSALAVMALVASQQTIVVRGLVLLLGLGLTVMTLRRFELGASKVPA